MNRQDFCDCLANTQEKPYFKIIQTLKALDLLRLNIDLRRLDDTHRPWAVGAYNRIEGIWRKYVESFEFRYGIDYRTNLSSYKYCENSMYPQIEMTSNLDESISMEDTPAQETDHELIYICAPLRGDVEANIEKAKQYAREVFLQGDIPICPHIYFPQFASVENEKEDRAAMDMGLALLKKCRRINVYADSPTAGMKEEIEAAKRWNIPVYNMSGQEKSSLKRAGHAR